MKSVLTTCVLLFFVVSAFAQNAGRMDFSVTSANIPGKYAPRHCIAIWVVDANGQYVNSMAVYGNKRLTYLTNWKGSSKNVKADAVTGATINGFRAYNVTWNLKDYSGNLVPKGTYKIKMEATCKNGTGVVYTIDAVVNDESYVTNPTGNNYFKSMKLSYTANDNTPIHKVENTPEFKLFPNPGSGKITLEFFQPNAEFIHIKLFDLSGKTLDELYAENIKAGLNSLELELDKSIEKGNYIINAQTDSYSWSKKIILE